jgi:hypothetical protein
MSEQVQISLDREVYDRLLMLMVPPIDDANAVIRTLLDHDGRTSEAARMTADSGRHFTYAQELERARMGIYEGGGST